jgi:hypothetical protein
MELPICNLVLMTGSPHEACLGSLQIGVAVWPPQSASIARWEESGSVFGTAAAASSLATREIIYGERLRAVPGIEFTRRSGFSRTDSSGSVY